MGRDTGTDEGWGPGTARLGRVLGPFVPSRSDQAEGWHDGDPSAGPDEPDEPRRGRHTGAGSTTAATGWRLAGVPAGAAVAAVVVAVVAGVLLLGGGVTGVTGGAGGGVGGGDEVLVGPTGVPPTAEPSNGAVEGGGPAGPGGAVGPGAEVGAVQDVPALAGVPPGRAGPGSAGPDAPQGSAAPGPTGPLVVHVDGAVARPGVVTVPAGSRVSDAVAAAGGVTGDADTRLVNLARLLLDGELVVVPRPGEAVAVGPGPAPGAAGPVVGGGAAGASAGAPAAPVDLNTADAAALDALPGIGPVLAERIVAHREEVGPFTAVEDLESVSGIGPSLLAAVRDLVRV